MSLSTNTKSDAYALARKLVMECYEISQELPPEEKTNLTRYLRSAAVTVFLNIARESVLKKRKKRKKFVASARNNIVVIIAVLEALGDVGLLPENRITTLQKSAAALRRMLKKKKMNG